MADNTVTVTYHGVPDASPPEVRGVLPLGMDDFTQPGEQHDFTESWYKRTFPYNTLSFYEFIAMLFAPNGLENVTPGRYTVEGVPKKHLGGKDDEAATDAAATAPLGPDAKRVADPEAKPEGGK